MASDEFYLPELPKMAKNVEQPKAVNLTFNEVVFLFFWSQKLVITFWRREKVPDFWGRKKDELSRTGKLRTLLIGAVPEEKTDCGQAKSIKARAIVSAFPTIRSQGLLTKSYDIFWHFAETLREKVST